MLSPTGSLHHQLHRQQSRWYPWRWVASGPVQGLGTLGRKPRGTVSALTELIGWCGHLTGDVTRPVRPVLTT